MLTRVVWVKESKNGIGFEIGPNYDDLPMRSQLVTYGQSSCIRGNYLSSAILNDINPLNINIMVNIDITIYQYPTSTIGPYSRDF